MSDQPTRESPGHFQSAHVVFHDCLPGWPEALQETDMGAYWPSASDAREPRLNQCGALIPRDDERLVQVVEELCAEANGHCAELKVVAIPDDVPWVIVKTDGSEHVSEQHRIWS